jgi:hypothetical protein
MRTSKLTLLAAALALGMAMGRGHDEAATKNKTFGQRLASWLGCLHTVVIHFPIALIIGAFAVGLLGLYRIEPKTGEAAERLGVAASVLKKMNGRWKIVSMHNSARKLKGT